MTGGNETTRTGADGRPWPGTLEMLAVWARIALLSFGGPAGQIAVMHKILVEEKRWISEGRFLHALNFCMLLPGPEAQQLATYIGWLVHRTWGGVVAGVLFILPGAIAIMGLSLVYVTHGDVPAIEGAFLGLKAAVLAIVLSATVRIGKRALRGAPAFLLAAASFFALFLLDAPFPLVVAGAALIGFIAGALGKDWFVGGGHHGPASEGAGDPALLDDREFSVVGRWSTLAPTAVAMLAWIVPVAGCLLWLGPTHVLGEIALFFSKLAVVTFGGAYAVLAYVAQAGVETHGWLEPGEMLDGLGMAETTPGPLIMVVQFVGFLGAYRDPSTGGTLGAGVLGALLTTWVTFAPCFLWIFAAAPHIEALRKSRALSTALAAITAAVSGVVLNLAVWFALHVIFREVRRFDLGPMSAPIPVAETLDSWSLGLSVLAILCVFFWKLGAVPVLLGAACLGLGSRLLMA